MKIGPDSVAKNAVEQAYAQYNPQQFSGINLNTPDAVEEKEFQIAGDQFGSAETGTLPVKVEGKERLTFSTFIPDTNKLYVLDKEARVLAQGTVALHDDGSGTVTWD